MPPSFNTGVGCVNVPWSIMPPGFKCLLVPGGWDNTPWFIMPPSLNTGGWVNINATWFLMRLGFKCLLVIMPLV